MFAKLVSPKTMSPLGIIGILASAKNSIFSGACQKIVFFAGGCTEPIFFLLSIQADVASLFVLKERVDLMLFLRPCA